MAQLIIAAAGAGIGGAIFGSAELFLGVTGKGLGWVAGAFLGSALAGGQHTSGPALDGLQLSAVEYPQPAAKDSTA